MEPVELERLIDRELKRLATPRAPETLLPRVLAAARALPEPSHSRPWTDWPRSWQVISAGALALIVAAAWLAWPGVREVIADSRLALAASALIRLTQPLAFGAFVLVVVMSAACAIGGMALKHVAFNGS